MGAALPQSVQEIADVIGRERALYLVGQLPRCGKRAWRVVLYVPQQLSSDHMLVELLGWEDAKALVAAFGGMILQLGTCRNVLRHYRNQTVARMYEDGMDIGDIADSIQMTERSVRNILWAMEPKEGYQRDIGKAGPAWKQIDLFG